MGLSTTLQAMPSFSKLPTSLPSSSHSPLLLVNPSLPLTQTTPIAVTATIPLSSLISSRNVSARASTSEDTSSGSSSFFDEKRDGAVIVEDVKPEETNSFRASVEDTQKELPAEEQGLSLDFLDKLDIKFDADDTGSIALYGGAAIVSLWLTSAVIGAIDSIPLFPKLLEVVGLGYTVWFTTRYLLFKKNRDELFAKIAEIKEQVIGSGDK